MLHRHAEALVHLPEDLLLLDEDAVELEPPDRVRREESRASPDTPSLSRGTAKAVTPRAPASSVVRAKTVYTSASGAFEIQVFVPVRRKRAALTVGAKGERGRVGAGVGLAEREGGHGLPGGQAWDPCLADLGAGVAQDRVAAEALERERRLRLCAPVGEPLAKQAQLDGRALALVREHVLEQPLVA